VNVIEELPRRVSDWEYNTVLAIVKKYEYEPGYFDYKDVLIPTRTEGSEFNERIRRTACSLANADGGFILFGILDRNKVVKSPEERIVGIPTNDDLCKKFADKLTPIQRAIYFEASPTAITLPTNPTRGIFVVYIPKSPLRPHMDESKGIFYRRGEGGTAEIMKFFEIQEQMMYTEERLRKLTLFRLELAQHQKTAKSLIEQEDNVIHNLLRFETGSFKMLLADVCGLIPPSTGLLEQLLNIPIYGNLINKRLEKNQIPGLMYQETESQRAFLIQGNLAFFDSLCSTCGQKLQEIFGEI